MDKAEAEAILEVYGDMGPQHIYAEFGEATLDQVLQALAVLGQLVVNDDGSFSLPEDAEAMLATQRKADHEQGEHDRDPRPYCELCQRR